MRPSPQHTVIGAGIGLAIASGATLIGIMQVPEHADRDLEMLLMTLASVKPIPTFVGGIAIGTIAGEITSALPPTPKQRQETRFTLAMGLFICASGIIFSTGLVTYCLALAGGAVAGHEIGLFHRQEQNLPKTDADLQESTVDPGSGP